MRRLRSTHVRGAARSKFFLAPKKRNESAISTSPESVTREAGRYIDSSWFQVLTRLDAHAHSSLTISWWNNVDGCHQKRNKNASAIVEVSLENSIFQDVQPTFSRIPPSDVKHLKCEAISFSRNSSNLGESCNFLGGSEIRKTCEETDLTAEIRRLHANSSLGKEMSKEKRFCPSTHADQQRPNDSCTDCQPRPSASQLETRGGSVVVANDNNSFLLPQRNATLRSTLYLNLVA